MSSWQILFPLEKEKQIPVSRNYHLIKVTGYNTNKWVSPLDSISMLFFILCFVCQVIPQDDNWGDNTTAITGNTSETGFSMEELDKFALADNDRQVSDKSQQ